MKSDILKIKPPKEYAEGIIKYEYGMDNRPEIIDYVKKGYSLAEARKMDVLVRIEAMKYHLSESTKESDTKSKEVEDVKEYIQSLIDEYNNM